MSRYFYFMYLVCMFVNTIFFTPRLLLLQRFEGGVMATILSVIIGSTYSILFLWAISKFPGEGIPEIFQREFPAFIRKPILIFLGLMWPFAGSVILIAFTIITLRFLNPETSLMMLLFCYCGICWWASTYRPQTILYVTEIIILFSLPVVLYIMYKAITSKWFNWSSLRILADYTFIWPSWTALAAATYSFTGYINMALYNRVFNPAHIRAKWLIPPLGVILLFSSVIVPVGLLGVDNVDSYIYTWITSADTLRMQFGVIERVVFLFLFIYIGFSLTYITITWNIGALMISSCFRKQNITWKKFRLPIHAVISMFYAVITFIAGLFTSDKSIFEWVTSWQILRLISETLLVIIVVALALRKGRKHA